MPAVVMTSFSSWGGRLNVLRWMKAGSAAAMAARFAVTSMALSPFSSVGGCWLTCHFSEGSCQVLAAFCDRGLQPFARVSPVRSKGHVVFPDMIEYAGQFHLITFGLKFLDGFLDEGNELRVEIPVFRFRSLRSPVIDLRAAVREFGDGNVAG